MNIEPPISFKKMDVEFTPEITFWIWAWKMESDRCWFILNFSNTHLMTCFNTPEEGNMQFIHIAKLVSAFHSGCDGVDSIALFCEAGIAYRPERNGNVIGYLDVDE
jgi:hypothetical protein